MIIRGSGRIGLPQQIKEGGSPETGSIHQQQRWHASRSSSGPRADGWLRQRHEDVRGGRHYQRNPAAAAHQNQWLRGAEDRQGQDGQRCQRG